VLKNPITVIYDTLQSKLGSPQDITKLIEDREGVEIDKAVDIPQPSKGIEEAKTAPSTVPSSKVKETSAV
jgi:hypothetical protein